MRKIKHNAKLMLKLCDGDDGDGDDDDDDEDGDDADDDGKMVLRYAKLLPTLCQADVCSLRVFACVLVRQCACECACFLASC